MTGFHNPGMKQATLGKHSFAAVTTAALGASAGTDPRPGTLLHTLMAAEVCSVDTTLVAFPE